jgi:NTP pyrophosphatase (non-canonical NTP hydrolase)
MTTTERATKMSDDRFSTSCEADAGRLSVASSSGGHSGASNGGIPDTSDENALSVWTLSQLQAEVIRARRKFPGNALLLAALTEEVGELARELLQRGGKERIRKEAYQVACVALRIVEEGDATFANVTDEQAKP